MRLLNRVVVPAFAADFPGRADTLDRARLPFYCINCYRKMETSYITSDFGPFCDDCLKELEPFLR